MLKIIQSNEAQNEIEKRGDEPFFIIGKNGIFLCKKSPLYSAIVKVEGIDYLPAVKEEVVLAADFPKIPGFLIAEAIDFFVSVWNKHRSEAILLLRLEKGRWQLVPVKQQVGAAGLSYEVGKETKIAGTIHSHGSMSSFFSTTDDSDDKLLNGVHIVIGNIDTGNFSIATSVSVNGKRFVCKAEDVVDGNWKIQVKVHEWLKFVEEKKAPASLVPYGGLPYTEHRTNFSPKTPKAIEEDDDNESNDIIDCLFMELQEKIGFLTPQEKRRFYNRIFEELGGDEIWSMLP